MPRMTSLLKSAALALAIIALAAPAMAAKPAAPATAPTETRPSSRSAMEVTIDRGEPLTLAAPASSIFIANPDVADVQVLTPTSIMVFGKKNGQTTLVVTGEGGRILANRTILVSQNLADLREALRTVVPGASVRVESVPNGIVLTGEVTDPAVAEDIRRMAARYVPADSGEIINRIKVRHSNQVEIRVRFAEVSREVDKRLGINWQHALSSGDFNFGMVNALTSVTDNLNNKITGGFQSGHYSVNAVIDALAKDGLVTVLAEPSLIAMSGQTASFLAGGEFPIPVPQSGDTITVEWKQYGVSLAFTPTIIGDGRINMHVRPEVSQLSEAGAIALSAGGSNFSIPALTTRRAETTVELASGQSFAVAGLLNNNQTQSVSKFPFLGDLPILGQLFRSSRFQNNESELVIIITPYVVKPSTQEKLALPTDGIKAPSDADQYFGLRQTNSDDAARAISGQPRAVPVETPVAPPPLPAPRAPVTSSSSAPAKMTPMSPSSTPAGGGFIVE